MRSKKRKGRNYRFGESSKPTSVSMPDTLRRIAKEHADARGVSFSELVVDCMFSGLLDRDGRLQDLLDREERGRGQVH
jgi:hypothetical protein